MIKIVVGAGLSSGLACFVDAWKRVENGDVAEDRILSFETREALERYFSESRPADEAEAYRLWCLAEAGSEKARARSNGDEPHSSSGSKGGGHDESFTLMTPSSLDERLPLRSSRNAMRQSARGFVPGDVTTLEPS